MRHHDALVTEIVELHGGVVGARTGDGAIALFEQAFSAAQAAVELQARIVHGPADTALATAALRIRVGLHRGVVEPRDGEHYGPPMHRAARIMGTAHGGQIVASVAVARELDHGHAGGLVLVGHGLYRLKGFHEPEHLVEILVAGASPDPRGLRAMSSEGSLPPFDMERFVGRDEEIERILPELRPGQVTTLVGTGGVGKTRLALQLARLSLHRFYEGAWFVDLASASGPERVLPLVASTLGVADVTTGTLVDSVREALHSRHMLVILDNCEHVVDAVSSLLRSVCSDRMTASILATSQRGLDVARERLEPIAPLAFDDHPEASAAGSLFIMAAHGADPRFRIGEGDADAIGRICRRLDGLPLAIELAAARVRVMPVQQIAEELQVSFDLLRSRDQPERHRTMTAAISWSLALLNEVDRATLLDLSVFYGTFDWEAAAAVSGRDRADVVDSLDELVQRSLLVRRGDGIRMLVPMRLHCGDELARSGREQAVRARHAAWVVATIPTPLDHLDPDIAAANVDRVIELGEDIHAAHRWLVPNDPAAAARFAINLSDAWLARTRSHEALQRMVECDTNATPPELRVEVLAWLAAYAWTVGRHDEGEAAARRALELAETTGLALPVFAATRLMVRCAFSNRTDEAVALAERIEHELRSGNGERTRQLGPLGVVHAVAGETERGIALADEGVAEARGVGSMRLLTALANRILLEPASEEVAALTVEVAELARILGRTSAQAHARGALAHQARRKGDLVGFLDGVGQFADLLLVDEPTTVLQMLQWVPPAVAAVLPRETAVLLSAIESLGDLHNYRGTDKEVLGRASLREQLRGVLGDHPYRDAETEGAALRLAEAVDRLHWMAESVPPSSPHR